jgi:hypothetical protein
MAYVKGKVIPVSVADREVDWLYYDLPDDLRPAAPDQVGTVVWLRWDKVKVGQYGNNGGDANVQTCDVTVIDLAARRVVDQRRFVGGEPPQSSRRGSSASGSKPTEPIVAYLKSLPRR